MASPTLEREFGTVRRQVQCSQAPQRALCQCQDAETLRVVAAFGFTGTSSGSTSRSCDSSPRSGTERIKAATASLPKALDDIRTQ